MKKYKIASLLMFIHGAFMEIGGCLALIPVFVIGSDKFDINQYIYQALDNYHHMELNLISTNIHVYF